MELLTKASFNGEVSEREKQNLEVAYRAACESMVLLKNENVLPLNTKKVALYGPGVTRTIKGGTGSGEVNERHSVTILEGMENRGFEVTTKQWIKDYEDAYEAGEIAHKKACTAIAFTPAFSISFAYSMQLIEFLSQPNLILQVTGFLTDSTIAFVTL